MRRQDELHSHPCQRCGKKTECDGETEANYDGDPEVICRFFHLPGGFLNLLFICDDCQEAETMELSEEFA